LRSRTTSPGSAWRLAPFLGKDDAPVRLYLEDAAGGLNEFHFRMREGITNLGRQTGGPRFVVSDDAVLDRDLHVVNDSRA